MATTTPGFRQLLSQLGFGELYQLETTIFIHDVKTFVETLNAGATRDLHLQVHSDDYQKLTVTFLDVHERGKTYWPEANASAKALRYIAQRNKIYWLMVPLFFRCNEHMHRWMRTPQIAGNEQIQPSKTLSVQILWNSRGTGGVLTRDAVLTLLSNEQGIGVIKFTYSVGEEHNSDMRYSTWSPQSRFEVRSLAQLMREVPGAAGASGLRIVFSGPGFCVAGEAFDEADLGRLKVEFNDQVCRTLVNRDSRTLSTDMNLHTQIFVIKEMRPLNRWIF